MTTTYKICTFRHPQGGWSWQVYKGEARLFEADYNYAETNQPTHTRTGARRAASLWMRAYHQKQQRLDNPEYRCEEFEQS